MTRVIVLLVALVLTAVPSRAQDIPFLTGRVVDDANIIDTLSAYVTSPAFAYRRSP